MTPPVSLVDLAPPGPADGSEPPVALDEFRLDLRVVESAAALAVIRCPTDDECGNTCAPSACNTSSNDPS
jgi:FxLD family lantipeptide